MTRVLVVAYFFPPKGGAGTQRFAKFCKYLPEHGIEPVVLAAGEDLHNRSAPNDDPTLVAEAAQVLVERVAEPTRTPFWFGVRRKLRFYLDEDVWAQVAGDRALTMARDHAVQAVITTLSPYACYRIGERLRAELDVPWIVDLRDPWALDGWRRYRSGFHARWDLGHMQRALTRADFVIANVPEAARAFVELGADPARTVVIPNGFDEQDFVGVRPPRADSRFRLVHMGTLHGVDAPAGLTTNRLTARRHRQIAPLGRTGHYLLHALARLQTRVPDLRNRLVVALYGNVDASHQQLAAHLGVADLIEQHGYVTHRASTAALLGADAVFVPLHGVAEGERALVVPGKLYEALASERPVLAALPPGDGFDLVHHLRAGRAVPPTDPDALAAALLELLELHWSGAPQRGCARDRLHPFTRRRLTGLLAQVVEAAVARAPTVAIENPWQALGVSAAEALAAVAEDRA